MHAGTGRVYKPMGKQPTKTAEIRAFLAGLTPLGWVGSESLGVGQQALDLPIRKIRRAAEAPLQGRHLGRVDLPVRGCSQHRDLDHALGRSVGRPLVIDRAPVIRVEDADEGTTPQADAIP